MAVSSKRSLGELSELSSIIRNHPIIDNHGHNILRFEHLDAFPFESITSEAQGEALEDSLSTLAHIRAAKDLKELYSCDQDADWNGIIRKRSQFLKTQSGYGDFIRKCLVGTHSILMDDGLDTTSRIIDFASHDDFTPGPTRRIVRIEELAEKIMRGQWLHIDKNDVESRLEGVREFQGFNSAFIDLLVGSQRDPDVAGFKSVVCYRSGLDVDITSSEEQNPNELVECYKRCIRQGFETSFRIQEKPLNDHLVLVTLRVLSTTHGSPAKPIQFHTGLGDADINLLRSNPAHLQLLIEHFPKVPFVILHSAYPYTREAGYLATVFKNVYFDLGEVFPQLSRDGQMSVLRQALELTPTSKLLWSTDGHFFPETYWLANRQFREILQEILSDYAQRGDISKAQAIAIATDIMFNNSNKLYRLNFEAPNLSSLVSQPEPATPSNDQISTVYDKILWNKFAKANKDIEFVYVQWLDYMATVRARVIPIVEFERLINTGGRIGISLGNIGTLQNDHITSVVNTTGQMYMEPDLRSIRRTHDKGPLQAASVMSSWRNERGEPMKQCPRSWLQSQLEILSHRHGIEFLLGFEVEVTFLRRIDGPERYSPLTTNHAWGTITPEQWTVAMPILGEIATSLKKIGIAVQQFHAEAGAGQYEFVLPPDEPVAAIDSLIQARQVIYQIAATHGLRATLHPMPIEGVGNAAHVHISMSSSKGEFIEEKEKKFFYNILAELRALCAFTMPEAESYKRVVSDSWTGGIWIAWGTQNRECPLRKVANGHWEMRCLDGMANMYLAMGAVFSAGLLGINSMGSVPLGDCPHNPARLTPKERLEYGIDSQLPSSIEEALDTLGNDTYGIGAVAPGIVHDYISMKREEQKMLGKMSEPDRRAWLIERY